MPCGRCRPSTTVSVPEPGHPHHPARAGLGDQHGAVGVDRDADRIVQAGRQHLDAAGPDRQHPPGALFGDDDGMPPGAIATP